MALHLYNTFSRARERFVPADPGRVTMYICGTTVYNFAHIGNARPYVVFDVLARMLRRSYTLVYARNFTDVDDKINAAARAEGIAIGELSERYVGAFHEDMEALGVLSPDVEPRVTGHIPEIVSFIERLIESGHAYEAEAHVLFSVASYARYGELSRRSRDDMIAGARVEVAPLKRAAADFVLWKPSAADDVGWDSPWGRGRPGWHIECSAMAEAHLGATIDIHGGGQDLVFPHHENESAQSTCAHGGELFCRYWLHNGLVRFGGEKMSKSVGNMRLVRRLLEEWPGEVLRLALLTAHYRQPLDWSPQLAIDARQKLERMYGALRDAGIAGSDRDDGEDPPPAVLAALENDLNTPQALAEIFELVRAANRSRDTGERLAAARSLRAGARLLGLLKRDPAEWFSRPNARCGGLSDDEIDVLIERREALRSDRKYAEADAVRDTLAQRGIILEDVSGGTRWRRVR